jgi:hypothetical protein
MPETLIKKKPAQVLKSLNPKNSKKLGVLHNLLPLKNIFLKKHIVQKQIIIHAHTLILINLTPYSYESVVDRDQ